MAATVCVEVTDREDTPAGLLAAIAETTTAATRVEIVKFRQAAVWADLHPAETVADAATLPGSQGAVLIAGEGPPLVADCCVPELAAALGVSTDAGYRYLGDAVEVRHRLPRIWGQVMTGRVPVWKARRVAQQTLDLSPAAAAFVDAQLAPALRGCSFAQIERTVAAARSRFDPDAAEQLRLAAAERRRLDVDTRHVDPADGTVAVFGVLDLADALDLDHALALGAAQLAAAGCAAPLDVRRAMTAGALARGEIALDLPLTASPDGPDDGVEEVDDAEPAEESGESAAADAGRGNGRVRRQLLIHVHLHARAITGPPSGGGPGSGGTDGGTGELVLDPVADVDNIRNHALIGQVRDWCRGPGTQVTIRPVLDLSEHLEVPGYAPSVTLRRQVELTHRECVFPHCHRPAAGCDLDHVIPHARGGPTCTCNLVPLCRRHHRYKTHAGWRLHRAGDRLLVWTSPHGRTYTVHTGQTDDITDHTHGHSQPGHDPGHDRDVADHPPDRHTH
jgi:hypothetical protein